MPSSSSDPFRVLLIFSLLSAVGCARFGRSPSPLPRFDSLNRWAYRGGQPTEEGLVELKNRGIRTVINFREESEWVEWEKKEVEELGMNFVSLPWSVWRSVDPTLLDRFFAVLDDSESRPVFFHCKHGRDRTGVMSTLALMRYEKLSEVEARRKALGKIRPQLRYRCFVRRKINFFLKARPSEFSESSVGDRGTFEQAEPTSVSPASA
jgi:protein tyrosine/serine phosphatase